MALWKRKSRDNRQAQQAAPTSASQIPQRRQPAPADAVFALPVPGHDDITVTVSATVGAAPGRGEPPILIARAQWDGVLDGEDPFGVALSVTLFNAANAAPRLQLYRDGAGHTRMALDTVLAGFGGFTEEQITDWAPMAAGLGEQLAEIVGQTWPHAPRTAHPDTDAAGAAGDPVEPSSLAGRLIDVVGAQLPASQATPVTPERLTALLFGPGTEDRVLEDGDGSRRVGFHWNGYDIDVTVVHDLVLVDTGVYIGGLDRPELESLASAVAAHNDNVTGTTAALVNLGSREEPDWVVRALIHRPASAMGDDQLELTVMSSAAMVSKTVADLLGRAAPGGI
ncbi:hypothetical protein [Corynebacterium kalidii]|uniref:YbjN domain-containing protein n=1 Tax=Corynebacterium kalidii TaxID=2931982 RepID=A0A9X2B191_9CORY|nr:hypothetical protein [Corynebacterium kalidii]MCJ7857460.1 hypothetical protein [Corynebacterium kalidii]